MNSSPDSETSIQSAILDFLNENTNGRFIRFANYPRYDRKTDTYFRQNNKHVPNGVSDIIGWWNSNGVVIEVKVPSEYKWLMKRYEMLRTTYVTSKKDVHAQNQIRFIEHVKSTGNLGFFTFSLDHVIKTMGIETLYHGVKNG